MFFLIILSLWLVPVVQASDNFNNNQDSLSVSQSLNNKGIDPLLLAIGDRVDLMSFMGKPVKIAILSYLKQYIPEENTEFVYIYPPKFFYNEKTNLFYTLPMESIYLASGKNINEKRVQFIKQNFSKFLDDLFVGKEKTLLGLKEALIYQMRKNPLPSEIFDQKTGSSENIALKTKEYMNNKEKMEEVLNSSDPNVQSMLKILLLNLIYSGVINQLNVENGQ